MRVKGGWVRIGRRLIGLWVYVGIDRGRWRRKKDWKGVDALANLAHAPFHIIPDVGHKGRQTTTKKLPKF